MNKTLMERERSMVSGAKLGQEFWAEAMETACYLVNRSPSSTLEDRTPQEVWTGKKPSLSHRREAIDSEDGKLWKETTVDEMAYLHKNEALDLVELLARRKPIGRKWVFKKKTNVEGNVEKYKAQLVAKGYSQVPGIDFGDMFSPIAKTDIAHAVGVLSRFMSKPGKEHWTAVKRVFRYLRGTSDYGLYYQGRPGLDRVLDIRGFVDAD
eukprot:PITA_12498